MKVLVAITGASGIAYGITLAKALEKKCELSVVVTDSAFKTAKAEGAVIPKFKRMYREEEIDAPPASGSAKFDAMIVCPCSMRTLAAIATGLSGNLVTRAADVMIKEKRRLVLVPRETPFSQIHLENMLRLAKLGVDILPACPGFYHKPKSVQDLVDFIAGKAMDLIGVENKLFERWG